MTQDKYFPTDNLKELKTQKFVLTRRNNRRPQMFNLEKFVNNAPESLINIKFNNKLIQSTVKFIKHKELSLIESRNLIELLIKWSNEIEQEIEKTGI